VIGALVTLGWMILKFGDRPAKMFATPSMPITFATDRADGLSEGSNVLYRGVIVGRVKTVRRTEDGREVLIESEVDRTPPLPANVEGVIRQLGQLGPTSAISLVLTNPQPTGQIAPGMRIHARYEGLSLFPPEVSELAVELKATVRQFRESNVIAHIDEQVQNLGRVMESANSLISDPKLREDIRTALANIRNASESVSRIGTKLDKLSDEVSGAVGDVRTTVNKAGNTVDSLGKQVSDRLAQVSVTLDHFNSIAAKLDNGQGTAGQLINDPKLYQGLVEASLQLNATIVDLKRLVEQWEQEGLHFKLK
jgi:phospholipid/cholesterol/gamma-HCH transport system substrate-binding protein